MWQTWKNNIKPQWKTAFFGTFLLGLLIHMPIMLSDIPNHDGLSSMYFDQNMITSGRWFLTVACGFSSYYTIPWVIGLLGLFFLALTAVALTEVLELREGWAVLLTGGLLVSFPALASTFAYVFTMDGYMLALLLAVLSVLFVEKFPFGFVAGGVCLAFSLGTYQAYLSVAILLCIYKILILCIEPGTGKEKLKNAANYLYMGVIGTGLYYVLLQLLLKMQGKELASYQGINGIEAGLGGRISESLVYMYRDFGAFTLKGNVLFHGFFALTALIFISLGCLLTLGSLFIRKKWWKNPGFFVIIAILVLVLPLATNVILLISPEVTYHLLMRYQWVIYLIGAVAFVNRYGKEAYGGFLARVWVLCGAAVLVFHYGVTDNIGYSNLEKRYEKTYAYCLRLLDRIEQTQGYYHGIPIAMIGVVGDEQFPPTDITAEVTGGMIGLSGDSLVYTGINYQAFMKHYLGATLNFLPQEAMTEIYDSPEYMEMESFPGKNATRVVDGVLYVKTENANR